MTDIPSLYECKQELPALFEQLLVRLQSFQQKMKKNHEQPQARIKSLQIKLKFFDFTSTTLECQAVCCEQKLYQQLLHSAWQRTGKPIRLLGLGVGFSYQESTDQQLRLF